MNYEACFVKTFLKAKIQTNDGKRAACPTIRTVGVHMSERKHVILRNEPPG
jgi:hypothetical protein